MLSGTTRRASQRKLAGVTVGCHHRRYQPPSRPWPGVSITTKEQVMHKKSRVLVSTGIVVVALVLGLGSRVLSASGKSAAVAPQAGRTTTAPPAAPDPNLYPFGVPTGGVAVQVPPPPASPTFAPTIATKTTTRIFGADPFQEAVSVTQHIWPSALPKNAPNGTPDRPRAVTLLTTA